MSTPLDTQARKQLLLTRIAFERTEWVRDVDTLRRHLTPSELLGSLLHRAGGGGFATALFGHREDGAASPGWAGRVMALVMMVRRHPLWWPLIAGVWPWLRKRRSVPGRSRSSGKLLLGTVGLAGAVLGGWWLSRGRANGRGGSR